MMPTPSGWTDERIEQLKKFLEDGYSASEAGRALGVTRNAIIGKVHRLKLTLKNAHGPRPARPRVPRSVDLRGPRPSRIAAIKGERLIDLKPEIVANPIGFLELEPHHCRWPVDGAGLAVMFCGADAIDKLSYCLRHCRMAYRAPEPRRSLGRTEIARRTAIKNFRNRAA